MSTLTSSTAAIYAAALGLLAALLTARVIMNRVRTRIQSGDGGDAALAQAIRAHANFAEQVPLALLLLVLVEVTGHHTLAVHGLGIALVVGRLANAWGLSHSLGPTTPRQAGAGLTLAVIVISSLLIAYQLILAGS